MKREKEPINTNLILYFLGRMVSDTGTSIQIIILPLFIIDVGGSAVTIGIFSFLSILPALIVSPFAGVIGDRLNRKMIMVITDLFSSVVILGLFSLSHLDLLSISMIMTAQAFISILNGIFESATRGMLPRLVNQDKLTKSNSTVASMKSLSYMLGPVLGAILYGNFGINSIFLINGISFLVSAISETMIQYQHDKRQATAGIEGLMDDLSEGFKFIKSKVIIGKLSIFFLLTYMFVQPIIAVVLPLHYKTSLEYSDTQYGYLQVIIVLGMLFGSIMAAMVFEKEKTITRPVMIGSVLLMGCMLAFSILIFPVVLLRIGNNSILYFSLLAGVLFLFSVANITISIPVQTYIQVNTPDEYMSRTFSLISMISKGGMPIGALIYGLILDSFDVHRTVLVLNKVL
jgi:MFS family permease